MPERVYLDWNATAPLRPQVRATMATAMDVLGNPSSVHAEGRAARSLIEDARERVAAAVMADPRNVIFTSGGSEANAMALSADLADQGGGRGCCDVALVSDLEHVSVKTGGGFHTRAIDRFGAGRDGVASLSDLQDRLKAARDKGSKMPLVALMAANNETGVVQPVGAAAELTHAAGGLLLVDAVQALGKIGLNISALGADLLTLSAHKIGGPAGVGALVLGSDRLHFGDGPRFGGSQERNRRGGTENLVGIVGFGAAVEAATRDLEGEGQRLSSLRQPLERGLREIWPETIIFGEESSRVPNTVQFAVPGIKAETVLIALDLEGVAVSSGSACTSGTVKFSEVVRGMGYDAGTAACAVRVSTGWTTTEADIDRFLQAWIKVSQPLRKTRGMAA